MKKQLLFSIVTLLFSTVGFTQYVLKTPDGRTVQLNENGTWKYVENSQKRVESNKIPSSSTEKYISKRKKMVIWYDPNQWICDTIKTSKGYWWDATFNSKDYEITGYCMDLRSAAPTDDLEPYIKSEFEGQGTIKSFSNFKDTINGLPLSGFDMELEWSGLLYQYRGYIYSTEKGSFQITMGAQKEIFKEDKQKILDLFKGMVLLQKP